MTIRQDSKENVNNDWLDVLKLRGRVTYNAKIGAQSWFKCGGTAHLLFKPADLEDLQHFLQNCPEDVPIHIFGALSNMIIRDGGVRGVCIRLGRRFSDINVQGDQVHVGTFALDANVAQIAAENGIGGLEFFSGIPGTIGGALRMNAGCYGSETKDVLVQCRTLDRQGHIHTYTPDQMGMTYRHIDLPEEMIFIDAVFQGKTETPEIVLSRMKEIKARREESQPLREKTGGSTFANPSPEDLKAAGLPEETKVWQLIDGVGGRDIKHGGAQMSAKHANFMINDGTATAGDLEALGEDLRARVCEKYGITLRWEIKRIGQES